MPRKAEPKMMNRLRDLRAEHEMTKQQLADQAGVTRQTIVAIERGGYTPSLALALTIATVFERSVESIFWIANSDTR